MGGAVAYERGVEQLGDLKGRVLFHEWGRDPASQGLPLGRRNRQ